MIPTFNTRRAPLFFPQLANLACAVAEHLDLYILAELGRYFHLEHPHLAIEIGTVKSKEAGRVGHIAAGSLDGLCDMLALKLVGSIV